MGDFEAGEKEGKEEEGREKLEEGKGQKERTRNTRLCMTSTSQSDLLDDKGPCRHNLLRVVK